MSDTVMEDGGQRAMESPSVAERTSGPVLWWALLGLVAVAVIGWAVANWLLYNFKPAPLSSTPPGEREAWTLFIVQLVAPLFPIVFGYRFIVQPWRRTGRLSWDGMFMLSCATILFQDPINNYFKFTFSYNTHLFNRSSWAPWIPGWEATGLENFAEPLLFIVPLCFTSFFLMSVFGCCVLDGLRGKLPALSFSTHCVLLYLILFAWDFIFEIWMVPAGLFTFSTVYAPLSIWAGQWYQFPMYEIMGVALLNVALTLIRYTRDADGLSFIERGIDTVPLKGSGRTLLRWLALTGAIQLITLVSFFVPYNWMSLKADSFARMPERFTYGLCGSGPGVQHPCPSPQDPYPGK